MSDDSGAAIFYGIEFPCRALCSVHGGLEDPAFIVGTQTLKKSDNQLHFLRVDSSGSLHNSVYSHPLGEIWHCSSSPANHRLLATCYSDYSASLDSSIPQSAPGGRDGSGCGGARRSAAIWRLPIDSATEATPGASGDVVSDITQLATLTAEESLCCVHWSPGEECQLLSAADYRLIVWDINAASQTTAVSVEVPCQFRRGSRLLGGKWNPHHPSREVVAIGDTSIRGFDLRSGQPCWTMNQAHAGGIRDFDFNPFNQYLLATGGDDCALCVWDLRKFSENDVKPLKQITSHAHWIWSVRYNPFHDRLLMTSSSDTQLHVSSLLSISCELADARHLLSADAVDADNAETAADRLSSQDSVCVRYDEHEDSIYSAEWSCCDAWTLASVSYDGRVVIRTLPATIRNDILT